jgi:hypothetical protein
VFAKQFERFKAGRAPLDANIAAQVFGNFSK